MNRWLLALAVSIVACGSILPATYRADDLPDLTSLTEEWGCGHGFWVGDAGQTVSLRISFLGEGSPPRQVELPHPDWEVNLIEGTDLFANWCDDVVEPDEPTPIRHWTLPVVGGHLELLGEPPEDFSGDSLGVRATDLMVELPDGDVVPLGSIEITNPLWGFFAG